MQKMIKPLIDKLFHIYCLNSKCQHYIEDSCEIDLTGKTLEIDERGKCALFKEGENEFYSHTLEQETIK